MDCILATPDGHGVGSKLLPKTDRHGVLHVGATSLEDAVELGRFALQSFDERSQHRC